MAFCPFKIRNGFLQLRRSNDGHGLRIDDEVGLHIHIVYFLCLSNTVPVTRRIWLGNEDATHNYTCVAVADTYHEKSVTIMSFLPFINAPIEFPVVNMSDAVNMVVDSNA